MIDLARTASSRREYIKEKFLMVGHPAAVNQRGLIGGIKRNLLSAIHKLKKAIRTPYDPLCLARCRFSTERPT
jgi:hypothetical protein